MARQQSRLAARRAASRVPDGVYPSARRVSDAARSAARRSAPVASERKVSRPPAPPAQTESVFDNVPKDATFQQATQIARSDSNVEQAPDVADVDKGLYATSQDGNPQTQDHPMDVDEEVASPVVSQELGDKGAEVLSSENKDKEETPTPKSSDNGKNTSDQVVSAQPSIEQVDTLQEDEPKLDQEEFDGRNNGDNTPLYEEGEELGENFYVNHHQEETKQKKGIRFIQKMFGFSVDQESVDLDEEHPDDAQDYREDREYDVSESGGGEEVEESLPSNFEATPSDDDPRAKQHPVIGPDIPYDQERDVQPQQKYRSLTPRSREQFDRDRQALEDAIYQKELAREPQEEDKSHTEGEQEPDGLWSTYDFSNGPLKVGAKNIKDTKKRIGAFTAAMTLTYSVILVAGTALAGYGFYVHTKVSEDRVATQAYQRGISEATGEATLESVMKKSSDEVKAQVVEAAGAALPANTSTTDAYLDGWSVPRGNETYGQANVSVCFTGDGVEGLKTVKAHFVSDSAQTTNPNWVVDTVYVTQEDCIHR